MEEMFTLYGAYDRNTKKLVSDITNPRKKYWDKKGAAINAVSNAMSRHIKNYDLEVVEIKCSFRVD